MLKLIVNASAYSGDQLRGLQRTSGARGRLTLAAATDSLGVGPPVFVSPPALPSAGLTRQLKYLSARPFSGSEVSDHSRPSPPPGAAGVSSAGGRCEAAAVSCLGPLSRLS
ncbi:hypothetical protein EVAR_16344_1 [Eumeta japonica]|uniref:Uncharacterized protein n=1 Tax=Eumeta variegata TaxID=151549 RepID=A0A4C1VFM5_EUMVA|nr:hypothetical protein EVAR_16344_1 [Eumeta japonica]